MLLFNVLFNEVLGYTFTSVVGSMNSSVTFNHVDIVKYLPMTLKLGYFFLFFFSFLNGKSLLMNVSDLPFVYGNKNS